jgi:hypothetical protein
MILSVLDERRLGLQAEDIVIEEICALSELMGARTIEEFIDV